MCHVSIHIPEHIMYISLPLNSNLLNLLDQPKLSYAPFPLSLDSLFSLRSNYFTVILELLPSA